MADPLDPIYESAGQEWNVDPNWIRAVQKQETGGARAPDRAVSSAGASGRMQFMPQTAAQVGVEDPTDPRQAIYGAAKYLSQLRDKYQNIPVATAAYNAGPDKIDQVLAGQAPLPNETAAYVPGVIKHYQGIVGNQSPVAKQATQPPDPFSQSLDDATRALAPQAAGSSASVPTMTVHPSAEQANDPFSQSLASATRMATPQPPAQTSSAAPGAPAAAPQTVLGSIGAGIGRAAHDMTDAPAELLAKGANAIGLTGVLNGLGVPAPTGQQAAAADQNALQSYNQNYGSNPIATTARIGGQIAGTLPLMASGGGMLGAAGDLAAAKAGQLSPFVGSAIEGASNLLSGTAGSGALGRTASLAANGALQGAGASALTAGQSPNSLGSQMESGAGIGAIAGPVGSALGPVVGSMFGRSATADPGIAALAQKARDVYGINITSPQMSTNSLVRIANDQSGKLPFSGAGDMLGEQAQAWRRAVIGQTGENATQATPDVMSAAAKRIGGVFNDVASRTNIQVDSPLMNALGRIETESAAGALGDGGAKAIKSQIDNIMNTAANGNGSIPGDAYQALTRAGAPLQRTEHAGDPNVRFYAGQIRDALDGAFQRSAAPEDQAALSQARYQWRSMKTIEDMAEKAPTGDISPALLMGAVRNASSRFDSSTGGKAYTGGGPLGDLANIGQQFLGHLSNSGTADRAAVNNGVGMLGKMMLGGAGAVGGSAAIANPFAAAGTAAALGAGLAANRGIGAYVRSGNLADKVIQNSLNPGANAAASSLLPQASGILYNRQRVPTMLVRPSPPQQ